MGISMITPVGAVKRRMQLSLRVFEEEVRNALAFLGEQCIGRIKNRSQEESWIDHTSNLRSSIAYAIYGYGRMQVKSQISGAGEEGKSVASSLLDSLSGVYADTYALVVIAGMSYAEYVEAHENKDVLASTEIWAKQKLSEVLARAKDKAIRRINSMKT